MKDKIIRHEGVDLDPRTELIAYRGRRIIYNRLLDTQCFEGEVGERLVDKMVDQARSKGATGIHIPKYEDLSAPPIEDEYED